MNFGGKSNWMKNLMISIGNWYKEYVLRAG